MPPVLNPATYSTQVPLIKLVGAQKNITLPDNNCTKISGTVGANGAGSNFVYECTMAAFNGSAATKVFTVYGGAFRRAQLFGALVT